MSNEPRREGSLLRQPIFVLAATGADVSATAKALCHALSDGPRWLLELGHDALSACPDLQPANRGWDSTRLSGTDVRPMRVATLERDWLARLPEAPEPTTDVMLVITLTDGCLQVPFLASAWPDARFVHLTADPEASEIERAAWWGSGGTDDVLSLPDWPGPAWVGPLTPGWRTLRGEDGSTIARHQWHSAHEILTRDLAALPRHRVLEVPARADRVEQVSTVVDWLSTPAARDGAEAASPLRSTSSTTFAELLDALNSTLLTTTYQSGYLVMARAAGDGQLNTHFRRFPSPMGMAYRDGLLTVGTKEEVITFANVEGIAPTLEPRGRHDACFLPRHTLHTGDIRVHDVAWAGGQLWAVATRFSCLVTFDGRHSFVPRWAPPFITQLAAEDRCHLNGLAVVDDKVAFVTALGTTDTQGGWRDTKATGGVIMDVESGEIVVHGLSMPHSPRWYRDQLWVLESGQGSLARVDLATGRLETVAQLPGFTRGLAFAGRYAFVGLSEVREANLFGGLPLTERLEERECGVWVVDIVTGETVAWLSFEDAVQEIYDVTLLPDIRWPELVGTGSGLTLNTFMLPPGR